MTIHFSLLKVDKINIVMKLFIRPLIALAWVTFSAIGQNLSTSSSPEAFWKTTNTFKKLHHQVTSINGKNNLDPSMRRISNGLIADNGSLIFHITSTKITFELNNNVTFKALQVSFMHVAYADVAHMTSIFNSSIASLDTDTLIVLVYDSSGDTLVPGHYIIAEIPVTLIDPLQVTIGSVVVAGSDNQPLANFQIYTTTEPVRVSSLLAPSRPVIFSLSQNYPNPFNPSTDIQIAVPYNCHVLVTVFNILGQEVRTLFDGQMTAGAQTLHWDGRNRFGQQVATGIYLYQMSTDDYFETKKMMFIK